MRLQMTLVFVLCIGFCVRQTAAADAKTATLTIVIYPCQKTSVRSPVVGIEGPATFLLIKGASRNGSWLFRVALRGGYYAVTDHSASCSAMANVAILPGIGRTVGIAEQATKIEKPSSQSGALAGTAPAPGLRVFVSPRDSRSGSGAWAFVDGRRFYAEALNLATIGWSFILAIAAALHRMLP